MTKDTISILTGEIVDECMELSMADLCRACHVPAEQVIAIVEEGVIDPEGDNPAQWRFQGNSLHRLNSVLRLQQDLGVNIAGAALALDLLTEVESLRNRLRRFEESGF